MAWIYIVSFEAPKALTLKPLLIHTGGKLRMWGSKAKLTICARRPLPLPWDIPTTHSRTRQRG